ncbi:hypothetical protein EW146_g7345 [Bondarzewia mesenterica]|uniref:Molybdenum cofactor sulfurase n=1 Tax=Bondarzewia mesenterica TaxID=1095465 RepID=A0A4S4LLM6_9AGAM|nr:hypothetical protein EW146_g7345 [Bondarzewia mesenterica]
MPGSIDLGFIHTVESTSRGDPSNVESGDAGSPSCYGMDSRSFSEMLEKEYPALRDAIYLDYAASPPAPLLSVISSLQARLSRSLFSNPHSLSPSSASSSSIIASTRSRLLSTLFKLPTPSHKDWVLIFTAGATAGCRLVAEAFDWHSNTHFVYTKEAHTSLVGIRGVALRDGASVRPLDLPQLENWLSNPLDSGPSTTLFAYPVQCNATGRRINLNLCTDVKRRRRSTRKTYVLIDAAAQLASSTLDLSQVELDDAPDFVVASLYKTYGYPTGLGILLVKRSSAPALLRRGYFGGGTIDGLTISSSSFLAVPRGSPSNTKDQDIDVEALHARFEDGTLPYLSIVAINEAMDVHERFFLSLDTEMKTLEHGNGQPVCRIYNTPPYPSSRYIDSMNGPTVAFTLLRPSGQPIGHIELARLCALNNIHLRAGSLCNMGAVAAALDLTDADIEVNIHRGSACWDEDEFGGVSGDKPTGMTRISFGAANRVQDVSRWIEFLKKFWTEDERASEAKEQACQTGMTLGDLVIYPIKSCGGISIPRDTPWSVNAHGLQYDREWMLIDPTTGRALSQKRYPRMCLVRSTIDLDHNLLRIRAGNSPKHFFVSLDPPRNDPSKADSIGRVCADVVRPHRYDDNGIDKFLSEFLGIPCALARLPSSSSSASDSMRHAHFPSQASSGTPPVPVPILLSNESPFLLLNQVSVDAVNAWLASDSADSHPIKASCFRGNMIIHPPSPSSSLTTCTSFVEDTFDLVRIGTQVFQSLAQCRRCQMVCVDQDTGVRSNQPYNILSLKRRNDKGRIMFGVHLMHRRDLSHEPHVVRAGDDIEAL